MVMPKRNKKTGRYMKARRSNPHRHRVRHAHPRKHRKSRR
jgi:hypothetical protein